MILQNFLFVDSMSGSTDKYCFEPFRNDRYMRKTGNIILFPGDSFHSDTYNNGLSLNVWGKDCGLDAFYFETTFSGHLCIQVCITKRPGEETLTILEEVFVHNSTSKTERINFNIDRCACGENDYVFVRFLALSETILQSARFGTQHPQRREVRLDICITTFKRHQEIKENAAKLYSAFGEVARIRVVDNEGALVADDFPEGVFLHRNPNVGGAGGFSRGMIESIDAGATHVLLMDDDASCDMEAIRRTKAFLAYAMDDKMAVAGIMMIKGRPKTIYEAGGISGLGRRPQCTNVDRTTRASKAITAPRQIDYGAWWFFAFKVSAVRVLAFPFFVRGDDVLFSVSNNLDVKCINGVHCIHDEFAVKKSPVTAYLQARDRIINHMLHPKEGEDWDSLRKFISKYFRLYNRAFCYISARYTIEAISDVMKGPVFFQDNANMERRFEELLESCGAEKRTPFAIGTFTPKQMSGKPASKIVRWLNYKTEFGHKNPLVNYFGRTQYIDIRRLPSPDLLNNARRIYYVDFSAMNYFIAEIDRSAYFENRARAQTLLKEFGKNYANIRQSYVDNLTEVASPEAWRARLALNSTPLEKPY